MKQITSKKQTILLLTTLLLLISTGYITWRFVQKQNAPFRRYTPPSTLTSNDSVFLPETSDLLQINNETYLISNSPIFGLPDALEIFSFGNVSPWVGFLSETGQYQDKDFNITWILRQGNLTIGKIDFLYHQKEVKNIIPTAALGRNP